MPLPLFRRLRLLHALSGAPTLATMGLVGTALCGQGCVLSGVIPSVVEAPPLQVRAVQFLGTSGAQGSVRLELVSYNPNTFDLYAQNLRATLSVAGQNFAVLEAEFAQQLPSRRPLVVLVDVTVTRMGSVPRAELDQSHLAAMGGGGAQTAIPRELQPMPFRVDGVVYFRSRYGNTHAPFAYQGTVSPGAL